MVVLSNTNNLAALNMHVFRRLALLIVVLVYSTTLVAQTVANNQTEALWAALQEGGHIAFMRHALAPGTGDPDNFRLDDCTTQRNLSAEGRNQARRIGAAFRQRQINVEQVLSSRWCRCLETARLLNLGPVKSYPVLDSFFRNRDQGPQQTRELMGFVSEKRSGSSTIVMVSHQVNITGLTGVFPRSGEIVVIRPDGNNFQVLGVLSP
jgi:phosphohistidine phosphatase SixA